MRKIWLVLFLFLQSLSAFYQNDLFEIVMFYDLQDSAIVNKDNMHGKDDPVFRLANWEIEIAGECNENISWSYAGAYDHNDEDFAGREYGPRWETAKWYISYAIASAAVFSYGQLDLPIGIDHRYYGAPDRFSTVDSLAEELHGAPNEDMLMLSGEQGSFNYAVYRSAGNADNQYADGGSLLYLGKDSTGGRAGFFLLPQLELGYSRLLEEAPAADLDNAFVRDIEAYDLTWKLNRQTHILAEAVRYGYGDGLAHSHYVMLVNQLGKWTISNRYGELNYDNAEKNDLQRITNAINYSVGENLRLGLDHQRNFELVKNGEEVANDVLTWQILLMI